MAGHEPGAQPGDVLLADVEPVLLADVVAHDLLEGAPVDRPALAELLEGDEARELLPRGLVRLRERHGAAGDLRVGDDRPVHGAQRAQGDGLRRLGARGGDGRPHGLVAHDERDAAAVVDVARRGERRWGAVRVAELLGERVDRVRVGGRPGPGEVLAVPDEDVRRGARERDAAGVEARPVELVLREDLGRVVGDLRAHRGDRHAAFAVLRVDQQGVGRVVRELQALGEVPGPGREPAPGAGGRRGPGARDDGVADLDAARVGERDGARVDLPRVVLGEAVRDDRHGLRVATGAEGRELAGARLGAEAALERPAQLPVGDLAAAVGGELGDQEHGGRQGVRDLPAPRGHTERGVLRGQQGRVVARLVEVGVDAVDVGDVVLAAHRALGPGLLRQGVELRLQLGRRGVLEGELLGVGGGRRRPEELDGARLRRVAQDVHEEHAVLRGDVPGAPHRVEPRRAVDARDAVDGVADDRHALARRLRRPRVLLRKAEGRRLPVAAELARGQPVGDARDARVALELVRERRRRRPGGLEAREVRGGGVLPLPDGQDAVEAALVAEGAGRGGGVGRCRERQQQQDQEQGAAGAHGAGPYDLPVRRRPGLSAGGAPRHPGGHRAHAPARARS